MRRRREINYRDNFLKAARKTARKFTSGCGTSMVSHVLGGRRQLALRAMLGFQGCTILSCDG